MSYEIDFLIYNWPKSDKVEIGPKVVALATNMSSQPAYPLLQQWMLKQSVHLLNTEDENAKQRRTQEGVCDLDVQPGSPTEEVPSDDELSPSLAKPTLPKLNAINNHEDAMTWACQCRGFPYPVGEDDGRFRPIESTNVSTDEDTMLDQPTVLRRT